MRLTREVLCHVIGGGNAMKRMLIAVGLSILLGGCMLKSYTYYKPIGPGGYYKDRCGGPDQDLGFEIANGVNLHIVSIIPDGSQRFGVSVYLAVMGSHTLEFLSPVFVVASGGESKEVVITEVIGITGLRDKTSYPVGLPIKAVSSSYSFELPIGEIEWKEFTLEFPRILIDSQEVAIPKIKFEYGKRRNLLFAC